MDNRDELVKIISESRSKVVRNDFGKIYHYTDIPEKLKKNLLTFDKNFNFDDFVAIYDISVFGNARWGIIFTLYGIYFNEIFVRKYFNYKDIKFMTIKDAKSNRPEEAELIISGDKEIAKIPSSFIDKIALKELLNTLIETSAKWAGKNHTEIPSGIVKDIQLSKEQMAKCHAIIHTASVAAGGVGTGLSQIPLSDNLIIAPIQITMVTSIGAVFNIKVTDGMAKGILSTLAASFIGRGISQLLFGWIPILGNVVNTATAASITEAVGWLAVKHFKDLEKKNKNVDPTIEIITDIKKASEIYEKKFRDQVELFLNQKKVYQGEREEFIKLIEEYENLVVGLQLSSNNYSGENKVQMDVFANRLIDLKHLPIDGISEILIGPGSDNEVLAD
jgi:uncharacterized protein (DUF697 family)